MSEHGLDRPRERGWSATGTDRRLVTALIPAHNEAPTIARTIRSLQCQSHPIARILVIDDQSTDGTAAVAEGLGAVVAHAPPGGRSKAAALNFGLQHVTTDLVLTIDADTTLAVDAVEAVVAALDDGRVAGAGGYLRPHAIETIWQRGRYVEYLYSWEFTKRIEDLIGQFLVLSGAFIVFRTEILRSCGGWSLHPIAVDLDLTWKLELAGYKLRCVRDAICYTMEPASSRFAFRQIGRWQHGFIQNVLRYRWQLLGQPLLGAKVVLSCLDRLLDGLLLFLVTPVLMVWIDPAFAVLFLLDVPVRALPALWLGSRRGEFGRALTGLPCLWLLRVITSAMFLRALYVELLVGRSLTVYHKGH